MIRRSRFEFGAEVFETSLPTRAWQPVDASVGGSRTSAAGVPASYVVRRDAIAELVVRVAETEWAAFLNLIVFGQSAQRITWFPDAEVDESVEVYLVAPAAGDSWSPTRDSNYPRVFDVTITLRGAGTDVPWRPFFEDI